jgi:hypothetical protein
LYRIVTRGQALLTERILVLLLTGLLLAGPASSLDLIAGGKSASVILLPEDAHADELLAARELTTHLQQMTGATLPTTSGRAPAGTIPIRIGLALLPGVAERIRLTSDDPAAFLLEITADGVSLAGLTAEGTLFATYALLERLGVRWYMPGELGTVVPQSDDVSLHPASDVISPSFAHRHLQAVSRDLPWYRRMRLGGDYFPGAHGIPLLPPADFATEPELFALVDGERTERQLCLGHPEVLRRATAAVQAYFEQNPEAPWIGLGPNDGRGFCEDDKCRALDGGQWDPFAAAESMTDRHIWFFNQLLAGLDDRFADRRIAFYAYATYKLPPVRWTTDARIVPALAPITLCRIHGMNNPVCPERSFYRELMQGWGQVVPEVFERGYYFNLADPGLPFSKVHAVRDEIPTALALGVSGWRVECMPSWAVHTPTLYVAAQLMWDTTIDVDDLLAQFHDGFFGPSAEPMAAYLSDVDDAFAHGDCHTGGSHCLRVLFPPERVTADSMRLETAMRLAQAQQPYAERVRVVRMGFERMRLFLRMLGERDTFDFAAAYASLQELYTLTDHMREYELADGAFLLSPRNTRGYLERFWSPAVETGYRATVEQGHLVMGLDETWDFLIDPDAVGESLGYFRQDLTGGNWQPLHTSSRSWGDQGLQYYKGRAWYRTQVDLPATATDTPLLLSFGGVDEVARVWLNGEFLGASEVGAFRPFELDATTAARAGASNTVVVEITNETLNELGTGGITAPVFFYGRHD